MKRAAMMFALLLIPGICAAGLFPDDAPDVEKADRAEVDKYIINQSFNAYFYLLSFKDDPDFAEQRFRLDGKYYEWMKTLNKLIPYADLAAIKYEPSKKAPDNKIYRIPRILGELQKEYSVSGGAETRQSLIIKDILGESFGKTKYRNPPGSIVLPF